MKVETTVTADVEVDISVEDFMICLCGQSPGETVAQFNRGISAFYVFLRKAPDDLLRLLNDKQRTIIVNALREQADRVEQMRLPSETKPDLRGSTTELSQVPQVFK
jgi:hypothetical protein